MTQVDFSLLNELFSSGLIRLGIFLFLLLCFNALFCFSVVEVCDHIMNYRQRKDQIKAYLQKHRFDHFRSFPFLDGTSVIVEDMGADSEPVVIAYINKGLNAERICEILNCDYLGEVYTPKKATRLFNCSIQRFEKDKKLKTPENEGERS